MQELDSSLITPLLCGRSFQTITFFETPLLPELRFCAGSWLSLTVPGDRSQKTGVGRQQTADCFRDPGLRRRSLRPVYYAVSCPSPAPKARHLRTCLPRFPSSVSCLLPPAFPWHLSVLCAFTPKNTIQLIAQHEVFHSLGRWARDSYR